MQSAVVRLTPHAETPHKADNPKLLRQLVSLCFQQRRKTLRNCLSSFADYIDQSAQPVELTKRPEQLSVKEFVTLSNHINHNKAALDE